MRAGAERRQPQAIEREQLAARHSSHATGAKHLYLHIPFCLQICPYCSFYKDLAGPGKADPLVDGIIREAELFAHGIAPETVFIGGGTPTALSVSQLERLFAGLGRHADFSRVTEFTIEMNPATVTAKKAELLQSRGVNRVSMGVQSWDPELLRVLGRVHDARQVRESFAVLRAAGYDNLNLDLIYGVPGQTLPQWEDSLRRTIELQPDHISAYCLTYEEDTEYFERLQRGEFRENTDQDAAFFERGVELLSDAGYAQYEISNHARPGRASLHNIAYWEGADYLGLGPSAWSTVGERRWQNVPDTAAYVRAMRSGVRPISTEEILPTETREAEKIAFGLRMNAGIDPAQLTGNRDLVTSLREEGLLEDHGPRVRLTARGRLLADEIAAELI
ncbi:MAG: Oxygen-independent coproporphyrinogen-III oxidase 1 [Verrucomicrobiota bacterium]|jgi:oxygen-independent coproporphyrinogen-3 oxidase